MKVPEKLVENSLFAPSKFSVLSDSDKVTVNMFNNLSCASSHIFTYETVAVEVHSRLGG